MNYTEELTAEIVKEYLEKPSKETILELAKKYNKSPKSIIGKLSREGVYQKQVYLTKRGEFPETKKEIIARIASKLNIDPERIQGLEKAPKSELKFLDSSIAGP